MNEMIGEVYVEVTGDDFKEIMPGSLLSFRNNDQNLSTTVENIIRKEAPELVSLCQGVHVIESPVYHSSENSVLLWIKSPGILNTSEPQRIKYSRLMKLRNNGDCRFCKQYIDGECRLNPPQWVQLGDVAECIYPRVDPTKPCSRIDNKSDSIERTINLLLEEESI